jgi:uncharacterized protein YdcH (DUF465 family)
MQVGPTGCSYDAFRITQGTNLMSHTPHDLHAEFPDSAEALHVLKTGNAHFAKIAAHYQEVNGEIHRIESGLEPASDDRTENLKKERLAILDQVAVMIKELAV